MLRFFRRPLVLVTMFGLLILNVLTVTVSGVDSLISGLVASALGVAATQTRIIYAFGLLGPNISHLKPLAIYLPFYPNFCPFL